MRSGVSSEVGITKHISAGFVSGLSSAIILQPFDLLKTRIQQTSTSSLHSSWYEIVRSPLAADRQRSKGAAGVQIIRKLWRGTLPSALRTSVGSAIYFSGLNTIRNYISINSAGANDPTGKRTQNSSSVLPRIQGIGNLVAGAFTRGAVGFVMMPLTVVKVRYEVGIKLLSSATPAILTYHCSLHFISIHPC